MDSTSRNLYNPHNKLVRPASMKVDYFSQKLQVGVEMNRAKSAKLLVQHGAPAGVHDNVGNSALSLLIEKLPDVAIEALDQFHSVSTINRREFFFLNYLGKLKILFIYRIFTLIKDKQRFFNKYYA
jgi:hypothetical protein